MSQLLEERVRALEDERAILDVMYRYAEALDYGDSGAFAACFSPGGTWTARRRHLPELHCAGREELAAFAARHTHAPEVVHKHMLLNPRIRLEGAVAHAVSYFTRLDEGAPGSRSHIYGMGRYIDELERSDDGAWTFRSRVVEMEDDHPLS